MVNFLYLCVLMVRLASVAADHACPSCGPSWSTFGIIREQTPSYDKSVRDDGVDDFYRQFSDYRTNILDSTVFPYDVKKIQLHGTTTLSFIYRDSVIVCVDSKASMGKYVSSRTVKKVFPVSKHIVSTMAGGAADCSFYIKLITRVLKIKEFNDGMVITPEMFAHTLAAELKTHRGKELSVGTMVTGWDQTRRCPAIYYVDDRGACVGGELFCVGSGAQFAYSVLDSHIAAVQQSQRIHGEQESSYDSSAARTTQASHLPDMQDSSGHGGRHRSNTDPISACDTACETVDYRDYRMGAQRRAVIAATRNAGRGARNRNLAYLAPARVGSSPLSATHPQLPFYSTKSSGGSSSSGSIGGDSNGNQHSRNRLLDGLELEEALEAAMWAVRHATYRDGFSGGYINVLQINATGVHHLRRVDSSTLTVM